MGLITKAIRGTQDVLPSQSHEWQYIERTLLQIARDYGYREIRTPVFEHTELFQRSVGETTDVYKKTCLRSTTKAVVLSHFVPKAQQVPCACCWNTD